VGADAGAREWMEAMFLPLLKPSLRMDLFCWRLCFLEFHSPGTPDKANALILFPGLPCLIPTGLFMNKWKHGL